MLSIKSAKAAQTVYNAGGEHYHFSMAVQEYGEEAVVNKMEAQNKEKGMSAVQAKKEAAIQFETIQGLENEQFHFKEMRKILAKEVCNQNDCNNASPLIA